MSVRHVPSGYEVGGDVWPLAVLDTGAGDLHTAIARALGFPAHYGRNLDALADCLRDVDPRTVLVWDGWSDFRAVHPRTFSVALDLLGDALTVLLRGD